MGPHAAREVSKDALTKAKHWETSGKSSRSNSLTKDDEDSIFSAVNFSGSEDVDNTEEFASIAIIPKRRRNSFIFVEYSASKDDLQKDYQGSSIFDPINDRHAQIGQI